jgi:hypothetical protein
MTTKSQGTKKNYPVDECEEGWKKFFIFLSALQGLGE